jgi:hypothetical protein
MISAKAQSAARVTSSRKQAEHHLAIAKWNAEEAKKEIAAVGQAKSGNEEK